MEFLRRCFIFIQPYFIYTYNKYGIDFGFSLKSIHLLIEIDLFTKIFWFGFPKTLLVRVYRWSIVYVYTFNSE